MNETAASLIAIVGFSIVLCFCYRQQIGWILRNPEIVCYWFIVIFLTVGLIWYVYMCWPMMFAPIYLAIKRNDINEVYKIGNIVFALMFWVGFGVAGAFWATLTKIEKVLDF